MFCRSVFISHKCGWHWHSRALTLYRGTFWAQKGAREGYTRRVLCCWGWKRRAFRSGLEEAGCEGCTCTVPTAGEKNKIKYIKSPPEVKEENKKAQVAAEARSGAVPAPPAARAGPSAAAARGVPSWAPPRRPAPRWVTGRSPGTTSPSSGAILTAWSCGAAGGAAPQAPLRGGPGAACGAVRAVLGRREGGRRDRAAPPRVWGEAGPMPRCCGENWAAS